MENINFDFENKEYLFFIKLVETVAHVGIIELEKISKTINEQEKFMYFRNIAELDYETLQKLENCVNPHSLVKIVEYVNTAVCIHCDTKEKKKSIEQNLQKHYKIQISWKVALE